MEKKRKVYIDILRLIAIFFVLYAHTDRLAVHHYFVEGGNGSYWIAYALQQLSYINNATFFAISGALLLDKEESLKQTFTKRILKYIVIIIIFGVFQYYYNYLQNPSIGFNFSDVVKTLYSTKIITQYWFLRTYLGFLVTLPLMRAMIKHCSEKILAYIVGVFLIINALLPVIEVLWDNGRIEFSTPFFETVMIYPLVGYYVEKYLYKRVGQIKYILLANVAGILALIADTWYSHSILINNEEAYVSASGFTMIMVMVLYLDARYICDFIFKKEKGIVSTILSYMGKGTLVVYLFEPQLREGFQFIYDKLYLKVSWLGATVVWLGAAMLTGIAVSLIWEGIKAIIKHFVLLIKNEHPFVTKH